MCGRYTLMTDENYKDILDIIQEVENNTGKSVEKTGEIYPTNTAPVLINRNGRRFADLFRWGFPNFYNKGVIINARAETAPEKPMFRPCFMDHRCVIPAAGFFEWDPSKRKVQFYRPDRALYMAGIFRVYNDISCYVILTTAANSSVSDIHSRMPLLLDPDQIEPWLQTREAALTILQGVPHVLQRMYA